MSLGDSFPQEIREEFAGRKIEIGCVFKVLAKFTDPPKEKIFVIVAKDDKSFSLATVLINTDLNANVNFSLDLKALHIPIEAKGREYLKHDSFVDCTALHECKISEANKWMTDDPGCHLGKMVEEDLRKVHMLITTSGTIKPFKKKQFGFM